MLARVTTFLAFLLVAAAPASAQWRESGKQVADDAWRKSDGEFAAMLVVTDRLDQFLLEWEKPDDPSHPPNISAAKSAKRGDVVWGIVIFTGCAPGEKKLCRADVDFEVLRPDGSQYASHKGAELWHAFPPAPHILQLSSARLGFQIELTDPLGTYRIRAVAHDKVAGRRVRLERTLEVQDRRPPPPPAARAPSH